MKNPKSSLLQLVGALVLCFGLTPQLGQAAVKDSNQAEQDILRIHPEEVTNLPLTIRTQLQERGCTIPQTPFWPSEIHNIVQGEFAEKGQQDWAVLCSRNSHSTIMIFWGGPVRCPSELSLLADDIFIQGLGKGKFGFSRKISVTTRASITHLADSFGEGGYPPPGEHQGLSDAFVEKASTGWYCSEGKWVPVAGMD